MECQALGGPGGGALTRAEVQAPAVLLQPLDPLLQLAPQRVVEQQLLALCGSQRAAEWLNRAGHGWWQGRQLGRLARAGQGSQGGWAWQGRQLGGAGQGGLGPSGLPQAAAHLQVLLGAL